MRKPGFKTVAFLFSCIPAATPSLAQTFTLLGDFSYPSGAASYPMVEDVGGGLYGLLTQGEVVGDGDVFELTRQTV